MNKEQSPVSILKNGLNFSRPIRAALGELYEVELEAAAPRKPCELTGKSYPHSSEIMEGAKSLECFDGESKERSMCS